MSWVRMRGKNINVINWQQKDRAVKTQVYKGEAQNWKKEKLTIKSSEEEGKAKTEEEKGTAAENKMLGNWKDWYHETMWNM